MLACGSAKDYRFLDSYGIAKVLDYVVASDVFDRKAWTMIAERA